MDLSLTVQTESKTVDKDAVVKMIKTAYKLGYQAVALNVVVGQNALNQKNKIPEPPVFHLGNEGLRECQTQKGTFKILTRLTAVASESLQCHRLFQSPVAKKYDLLAIVPCQEKLFQQLCNQGEFDIISLPLDRMYFNVKRPQFGSAVGRGLFFEIQYAPCIRDQSARQHIIGRSYGFMQMSKGKGVIISSGATQPHHLRSPADAANLGFLFSMTESTTRDAIYGNCKSAILHAETRRRNDRAIIYSKDISKLPKDDLWLVEACKLPEEYESTSKRVPEDNTEAEPPKKKRKRKGGSKSAASSSV